MSRLRVIEERANIASAALDAYHAWADQAAEEVGTTHRQARDRLGDERKCAGGALRGLAVVVARSDQKAEDALLDMAAAVEQGYSRREWTLWIKRLAAQAGGGS